MFAKEDSGDKSGASSRDGAQKNYIRLPRIIINWVCLSVQGCEDQLGVRRKSSFVKRSKYDDDDEEQNTPREQRILIFQNHHRNELNWLEFNEAPHNISIQLILIPLIHSTLRSHNPLSFTRQLPFIPHSPSDSISSCGAFDKTCTAPQQNSYESCCQERRYFELLMASLYIVDRSFGAISLPHKGHSFIPNRVKTHIF